MSVLGSRMYGALSTDYRYRPDASSDRFLLQVLPNNDLRLVHSKQLVLHYHELIPQTIVYPI
jgi:hypothetical protein